MARIKKGRREKPAEKPVAKRAMARQQADFLDALMSCGNVTKAAEISKVSRKTIYNWRRTNEKFRAAWDEAAELGTDALEDEANRRAFEGVDRPVFQGKELVGHIREFSDVLLIFLLKGRRPGKYRERVSTEITGANGGPVKQEHSTAIPPEQFEKLPLSERLQVLQRALGTPSRN